VPGAWVARGAVLALLAPSLGEGGGAAIAEARARLREAEDEHERAKRLFAVEAVPQRRVHEAEIRLAAAREALSGYAGGELTDGNRIAVRAPLGGTVAARLVTPGSRVEAGAPLFDIVDASTVWLRADLPAALASAVSRTAVAEFRVEGATATIRSGRLVSVGSIVDSMSRTIPVRFEVPNASGRVPIGATARVTVRSGTRERGLLIPATAVLEEDGRTIVYVQPEGERFERREVVLGPSEGGRVLVRSGIAATDRVVTGAAYQVRLASLSTAVPMQGHEH
jgi:RND family efflux transporter MFP subunit